ncbi:Protein tramtrack, beta isoform [Frankliniella fusca]|uniref:Protein tramtrack, beta isoform n=1 Tax=Frankliniella fusca TaxID=407009 RepID=A0AAE1LJV1_9NEOP|nr:Protein tramtrack, beta isoform [Frankliniella fusca]
MSSWRGNAAPQVTTININTPSSSSPAAAYDALRGRGPAPGPGPGRGPQPRAPGPGRGTFAGGATRGGRALGRGGAGGAADMAYQCSRCPKRFATLSNLRRHYLNLHGPDRGPFLCPFCGKLTKNKISLKSHIYAYHKLHGGAAAGAGAQQQQQWPDAAGAANHPD